jgi:hypothetical protein
MNQSTLSTDFIRRQPTRTLKESAQPSPHTYVHTRVINSRRKPDKTQADEAQDRAKTKKHLVALADGLNESELAYKLKRCHSAVGFLTCGQHAYKYMPNFTCEFRLCPNCSRRRSKKINNKYISPVLVYSKIHRVAPVHIVLTQAQKKGETLNQSVKRLTAAFRKLIRSDRKGSIWNEYFRGGLFAVETKLTEDGLYHTHLHILAFRKRFFDIELLRKEWEAVGGGKNLRLDPITDITKGLREVLKYVSKPLDINRFTAQHLRDFLNMKNARFFGTFGDFRKFSSDFEESEYPHILAELKDDPSAIDYAELVEGSLCPDCAQPLFELRMTENEHLRFLQSFALSKRSP